MLEAYFFDFGTIFHFTFYLPCRQAGIINFT